MRMKTTTHSQSTEKNTSDCIHVHVYVFKDAKAKEVDNTILIFTLYRHTVEAFVRIFGNLNVHFQPNKI